MKSKLTQQEKTRLVQFNRAMDIIKKFGFSIEEAGQLINVRPRTLFRILAGQRPVQFEELIQLQTASITCLKLQAKKVLGGMNIEEVVT